MTSVLLSCLCKKEYDYSAPPRTGDYVICLTHGNAYVLAPPSILQCRDCDYRKDYSAAAKLAICTTAMKHSLKRRHRVEHYNPLDKDGTMCLHIPSPAPKFETKAPPF